MELLAPAGSLAHLKTAVAAGADAVYLGGKAFSARQSAVNFDYEELREAVTLCHLHDVAVYVTVNILVADAETENFKHFIRELAELSVDAVIVQDIGVAQIIRRAAPLLAIHGSTQMSVSDLAGVEFLAKEGFTRVVLARELSLAEIQEITEQASIEIEIFIHGALCVSYSGQCLMSSFIGGRSGNRGACAQPCRMPYDLVDASGGRKNPAAEQYVLSPKDMISTDVIAELVQTKVASLKIEGRMKQIPYVYTTVKTYRQLIDGEINAQVAQTMLAKSFNRGFTKAYWYDSVGRDYLTRFAPNYHGEPIGILTKIDKTKELAVFAMSHIPANANGVYKYIAKDGGLCYVAGKDVTYQSGKKELHFHYAEFPKEDTKLYWQSSDQPANVTADIVAIPTYWDVHAVVGEPLRMKVRTEEGIAVEIVSDFNVPMARTQPTDLNLVKTQLSRLGNTAFILAGVTLTEGHFMLPKSVLNHVRTQAQTALTEAILQTYKERHFQAVPTVYDRVKPHVLPSLKSVAVRARTLAEVETALTEKANEIIFGGDIFTGETYTTQDYAQVVMRSRQHHARVGLAMPRLTRQKEAAEVDRMLQDMAAAQPDFILIHAYSDAQRLAEFAPQMPFYVAPTLNVFNQESLRFWQQHGASAIFLSQELTLAQIRGILRQYDGSLGVYACGRTELMVTENNLYSAYGDEKGTDHGVRDWSLRDRLGKEFPLQTDQFGRMHIFNSVPTDMAPALVRLSQYGVHKVVIDAAVLSQNELAQAVKIYAALWLQGAEFTNGVFPQATRGHLQRGIM